MVRFVFTVEDLARTRFAISPMWEAVHSLAALRDPSTAALHVPWLRKFFARNGIAIVRPYHIECVVAPGDGQGRAHLVAEG